MLEFFKSQSFSSYRTKSLKPIDHNAQNRAKSQKVSLIFNQTKMLVLENRFSFKKPNVQLVIQIEINHFPNRNNQISKMNLKKMFGFGLIAALVGCQQANVATCVEKPAVQSTNYVTVPPSRNGPVPQNQGKPVYQRNSVSGSRAQDQSGNSGRGQSQSVAKEKKRGVKSQSGHVHTESNRAGSNPNGNHSKRRWTSRTGESHEAEQSSDKEGNVHQVHRWTDKDGRSHETDDWNDGKTGKTHQCHRWIDDEGTTHEAVQVTDKKGEVKIEHFTKDRNGTIRKVEPKKRRDESRSKKNHGKDSEYKSQTLKPPVQPPYIPIPMPQPGIIVHSADCAASKPRPNSNLRSNS